MNDTKFYYYPNQRKRFEVPKVEEPKVDYESILKLIDDRIELIDEQIKGIESMQYLYGARTELVKLRYDINKMCTLSKKGGN